MTTYIQAAVSGVMIGGLYAVMALGLSLTWGLLKVINLAHLALILASAYVTYQLTTSTGADPLLSVLILVPALFAVGVAIQWVIERFAVDEFNSLLLSFGLFIIAIRLINNIWSADFRRISETENPYASHALFIGSIALPVPQLLALGAAVAFAVAAFLVLRYTYFGKALRALAHDREIAAAFGVNHRAIGMVAAGLGASMGGVAGALIAINQSIFPQLAFEWVGLVFTVVILGGIGNLLGAVGAGILIGVLSSVVGVAWTHQGAPLVVFLVLILALIFRPDGLFGRLGSS
ncbi:MAG: branched-chain amino acid ABC transporter permease [Gaiellaceae bacterium]